MDFSHRFVVKIVKFVGRKDEDRLKSLRLVKALIKRRFNLVAADVLLISVFQPNVFDLKF